MKTVFVVLLVFLASIVLAYQAPLTDFGFKEVSNSTPSSEQCSEFLVSLPGEAVNEKGEGILSINADFVADANDSTYVTVSINDEQTEILWKEDFSCNSLCWARIFVPSLKEENSKIKLCAVLGGASEKLTLNSTSFLGIYDTPVLGIQTTAPEIIYLGERAKMSIIVTNKGTKPASVFVQFVHPDTRAKVPITSFDIVEGDSSATKTIDEGDTEKFDYYIKPTLVSSYNLPSAALFFTNYFGEEQVIISNHEMMSVLNPKQLGVSLVSISEQEPLIFKAIIKNNWSKEFNGTITISPQTQFIDSVQEIIVSPLSEKEIFFDAKPSLEGKNSFFVTIRDENNIFSSNKIEVETKQLFSPQLLLAILGVIIGIGIFGWIYFAKK
jgi:hypothetical protein